MNYETRSIVEPIEFRSAGPGKISAAGVAMRYGAISKPVTKAGRGIFRETFQPGAFAKTIQEQDVRSHMEHFGPYLGRISNGSLRLTDDRSALVYELDLPDTTAGRDAAALLERGDIKGCSIGFRSLPTNGDDWDGKADDGLTLRTVREAHLGVIDLTVAPAYDDSTAEMALRSLATSRHLDLTEVIAAAEAGDLRSILDREVEGEHDEIDSGRVTTARQRITHLFV